VSERSEELRRQRDLLREHLAWIEREISAEAARPAPDIERADAPPVLASAPFQALPVASDSDAERILAEFRRTSPAIQSQTKRGCILYFAIAVALILGVAFAFFFFYSRSRQGH
jgi:hypothetical protein